MLKTEVNTLVKKGIQSTMILKKARILNLWDRYYSYGSVKCPSY